MQAYLVEEVEADLVRCDFHLPSTCAPLACHSESECLHYANTLLIQDFRMNVGKTSSCFKDRVRFVSVQTCCHQSAGNVATAGWRTQQQMQYKHDAPKKRMLHIVMVQASLNYTVNTTQSCC